MGEMKDLTANPAPLGLLAFGMTTILLNLHNIGMIELSSMILATGIFYGGLAQLLVGMMEWKKGNTFGAGKLSDFTWKDLFDAYSCTECGRCQDVCPATNTGKPLNPRLVIHDMKLNLLIDDQLAIRREYGVDTLPTTIIIDRGGVIRRRIVGYTEADEKEIDVILDRLVHSAHKIHLDGDSMRRRAAAAASKPAATRKKIDGA